MPKLRPFRNALRAVHAVFCSAILCCICSCRFFSPVPAYAEDTIIDLPELGIQDHGIFYTVSDALNEKMESVFQGNINLAMDSAGTPVEISLAVSSSMNIYTTYYAYNSRISLSGMQCYIYAQAAYAALFDDLPYHGGGTIDYQHSTQVMGHAPTADYTLFTAAKVMPGAYLRTTGDANGEYNGSNGHSLIVLGYNEDGLTILEGNADNRGLIRIASYTWDKFNESVLTRCNRVICHVVQPREDVYLNDYGITFEMLAADTGTELPEEDVPPVPDGEFTMHRLNGQLQLPVPGEDLIWSSSDETIASVDDTGMVTGMGDGTVTITAANDTETFTFVVELQLVAWESLGDLNGDGTVDTADAISVLEHYTALVIDPDAALNEVTALLADVNDNGTLDTADVMLILQYYTGAMMNGELSAETLWNALL